MNSLYLWLKALHIIGVICWFAGIFYLPRLFVYHAQLPNDDRTSHERFQIMESKLYRVIMNPSMIVTLVFGVWLLVLNWSAYHTQFWIWIKIAFVVGMIGYHHVCGVVIKGFASGTAPHSEKFFRGFNEVPVAALLVIVVMVVVKPF